jgi:hypothetical protein
MNPGSAASTTAQRSLADQMRFGSTFSENTEGTCTENTRSRPEEAWLSNTPKRVQFNYTRSNFGQETPLSLADFAQRRSQEEYIFL